MIKTKTSGLIATLILSFLICIGVQAEFTESVNTVMSVRSVNGEEICSPEELDTGEYNVILNIGNLSSEAKQIEVYVAVKADGKLCSVKTRTTNLENKELMQIYPIEIPVTLAKDTSGKEISIEAYCWDDTMVPFNEKVVFGEVSYTVDTNIAIYNIKGSAYNPVYDTVVETIEVYTEGNEESVTLCVAPGTDITLKRGDVFVYEVNSGGYVDEIFTLFSYAGADKYSDFMRYMTSATLGYKEVYSSDGIYSKSIPVLSNMPDDWIKTNASTKTGDVDFIYGVITDKDQWSVSIAQIEKDYYINNSENTVSGEIVKTLKADYYDVASDANVYIYDYSETKVTNRLSVGGRPNIEKTVVRDYITTISGAEAFTVMEDESTYRELNFLFGKVVDGEITECLVILGSY